MNFLKLLFAISPALEAGKTLKNPRTWANVAIASQTLVVVLGFLLAALKTFGYDFPISDAQIVQLASAAAGIGGTVIGYLQVATNPISGIKK